MIKAKKTYHIQQTILYLVLLLGIQYHFNLEYIKMEDAPMRTPLASDYVIPAINLHYAIPEVHAEETENVPLVTPTPHIEQIAPQNNVYTNSWEEFQAEAHRIGAERDYPAKIIIVQAALESGRGTSYFARERNNYMGLCAYDSNPNQACSFDSIAQQIHFYVDLMERAPRYTKVWENRHNAEVAIQEIKNAGYATDPAYVQKLMGMPEWE